VTGADAAGGFLRFLDAASAGAATRAAAAIRVVVRMRNFTVGSYSWLEQLGS
jgi:hypothetical protein